ncbi:hypothetical protein ES702_07395 [subsurface metagenome]
MELVFYGCMIIAGAILIAAGAISSGLKDVRKSIDAKS